MCHKPLWAVIGAFYVFMAIYTKKRERNRQRASERPKVRKKQ